MAQKDSDLQKIEELIEIMKRNGLVEVEIQHGDDKIFLRRSESQSATGKAINVVPMAGQSSSAVSVHPNETPSPVEDIASKQGLVEIKSPLIGTFYATPSPDSQPYVEIGSQVDAQTV
jgi:acetyl-CoA carboxylase biotin carboxyl carrier protein